MQKILTKFFLIHMLVKASNNSIETTKSHKHTETHLLKSQSTSTSSLNCHTGYNQSLENNSNSSSRYRYENLIMKDLDEKNLTFENEKFSNSSSHNQQLQFNNSITTTNDSSSEEIKISEPVFHLNSMPTPGKRRAVPPNILRAIRSSNESDAYRKPISGQGSNITLVNNSNQERREKNSNQVFAYMMVNPPLPPRNIKTSSKNNCDNDSNTSSYRSERQNNTTPRSMKESYISSIKNNCFKAHSDPNSYSNTVSKDESNIDFGSKGDRKSEKTSGHHFNDLTNKHSTMQSFSSSNKSRSSIKNRKDENFGSDIDQYERKTSDSHNNNIKVSDSVLAFNSMSISGKRPSTSSNSNRLTRSNDESDKSSRRKPFVRQMAVPDSYQNPISRQGSNVNLSHISNQEERQKNSDQLFNYMKGTPPLPPRISIKSNEHKSSSKSSCDDDSNTRGYQFEKQMTGSYHNDYITSDSRHDRNLKSESKNRFISSEKDAKSNEESTISSGKRSHLRERSKSNLQQKSLSRQTSNIALASRSNLASGKKSHQCSSDMMNKCLITSTSSVQSSSNSSSKYKPALKNNHELGSTDSHIQPRANRSLSNPENNINRPLDKRRPSEPNYSTNNSTLKISGSDIRLRQEHHNFKQYSQKDPGSSPVINQKELKKSIPNDQSSVISDQNIEKKKPSKKNKIISLIKKFVTTSKKSSSSSSETDEESSSETRESDKSLNSKLKFNPKIEINKTLSVKNNNKVSTSSIDNRLTKEKRNLDGKKSKNKGSSSGSFERSTGLSSKGTSESIDNEENDSKSSSEDSEAILENPSSSSSSNLFSSEDEYISSNN